MIIYSGVLSRVCGHVSRLWEKGIKRNYVEKTAFKSFIDTCILCLWGFCIHFYSGHLFVSLVGIGIIYGFLSQAIFIDEGFLFIDILMPIMTVFVFYGSVLLYAYVPMITLLFGIFIIPAMTNQIIDKYLNYINNVDSDEEFISVMLFLYSVIVSVIGIFYPSIMYRAKGSVRSCVL